MVPMSRDLNRKVFRHAKVPVCRSEQYSTMVCRARIVGSHPICESASGWIPERFQMTSILLKNTIEQVRNIGGLRGLPVRFRLTGWRVQIAPGTPDSSGAEGAPGAHITDRITNHAGGIAFRIEPQAFGRNAHG